MKQAVLSREKLEIARAEIVVKPWGREELMEVNDRYMVKRLLMRDGQQCSVQYHEYKRETIVVLKGKLTIVEKEGEIVLKRGESVTIQPFQQHRMAARQGDCVYLECSTPEMTDVVRLEDDYGRK